MRIPFHFLFHVSREDKKKKKTGKKEKKNTEKAESISRGGFIGFSFIVYPKEKTTIRPENFFES